MLLAVVLLQPQPRHHLKASSAVVVGAFPRIDFVLFVAGNAIARNFPEPFPVLMIDHVLVDELPASASGGAKVFLPGKLGRIQKSDYSFRLRPPMLVVINDFALFRFVQHAAILIDGLTLNRLPHANVLLLHSGT